VTPNIRLPMKTIRPSNSLPRRRTVYALSLLIGITLLSAATVILHAQGSTTPQTFVTLFLVNSTGDGPEASNDAQCETAVGNGVCTLRAAIQLIDARNTGTDVISFNIPTSDPGCSGGVCTIQTGAPALPDIATGTSISGPGPNALTVNTRSLSANSRVFNVTTTGIVKLSGLTLSGFASNDNGGVIQNANTGTVNIMNCVLTGGNSSGSGGGVYNASGGTVNITNSAFSSNSAVFLGGAIYNGYSGTVTITNSIFNGNFVSGGDYSSGQQYGPNGAGGAIFNGHNMTVVNSTFVNNSAESGGAIDADNGTTTITGSTFTRNSASTTSPGDGGGAIYTGFFGVVNVVNSTLIGNGAFGLGCYGGAIVADNGRGASLVLTNSTIAYNTLFGQGPNNTLGGGVFGAATVKSSIIALNSADNGPDVDGFFTSAGFNLIGKTDGGSGFTATTDLRGTIASPLNPQFDPNGLRNNGGPTQTIALTLGSPAVNQGSANGLTGHLTTDQRGHPRTVLDPSMPKASGGDGTDIGAYELGPGRADVTVQTNVTGVSFSVDGVTYTSAQTFVWEPGSTHTIATTSPQAGATGVRYVWASWSDKGTILHTVAPTTNTTYTATFSTQYFLTMSAGTGGTVSPASGWENSGASISIKATPATGFSFTSWSGSGNGSFSGPTNPVSIKMNGPISEAATFTHN
jgi:CSLREA domain-containing protein